MSNNTGTHYATRALSALKELKTLESCARAGMVGRSMRAELAARLDCIVDLAASRESKGGKPNPDTYLLLKVVDTAMELFAVNGKEQAKGDAPDLKRVFARREESEGASLQS